MKLKTLVASLALTATVLPAAASADYFYKGPELFRDIKGPELFRHIASFDVTRNVIDEESTSEVAEIVDATRDGKTLVYADADANLIGFVDISNPADPQPAGVFNLDGEPTSVAIRGRYALVGVNTSETEEVLCIDPGDDGVYADPPGHEESDDEVEEIEFITEWKGKLVVVDIKDIESPTMVAELDLDGQPDSVAVSPNGRFAAIAIENERNEDVGGGFIPQGSDTVDLDPSPDCDLVAEGDPKPGKLVVVDMWGKPAKWKTRDVDFTGLDMFAASDPEPEFVDINWRNLAAVTLQENNHIVIVDLRRGKVVNDFSAGEAALYNVDTEEEDLINLDSNIVKRREPDAIAWTSLFHFATANEGDYEDEFGEEGGSRGITIFNKWGGVTYESGESFEHTLVSAGHYNEGRSENKGVEPEGVEYARFGRDRLLFTGAERSNAVGVYKLRYFGEPQLLQVLPTGIGPEGLKAIPNRDLVVVSAEVSETGIPSMINIYERKKGGDNYPQIVSVDDENGLPIPWVALSDLVAHPEDPYTLYAVSDSFLAEGFVYTIDVSQKPALITGRTKVDTTNIPTSLIEGRRLDLEGIAVGPDGNFWLASEGQTLGDERRENLVLKVDADGNVLDTITLPENLIDSRRGNGLEGIAVTGGPGSELVHVVIQRAWPDEGDTDQGEVDEPNTKIGRYDVANGIWGFVHYQLERTAQEDDWIGLSGITAMPDGSFYVIERDKGWGPTSEPVAALKGIYQVDLAAADFREYIEPLADNPLETVDKKPIANLTDTIGENSIWTAEKLEGFAVTADHQIYAVTDNDGIDDAPGETVFLHLGDFESFGGGAD